MAFANFCDASNPRYRVFRKKKNGVKEEFLDRMPLLDMKREFQIILSDDKKREF
jgi:hypothetical protein